MESEVADIASKWQRTAGLSLSRCFSAAELLEKILMTEMFDVPHSIEIVVEI